MAIDNESVDFEKRIIADIRERTGLCFVHIASADTTIKTIADAVLPVLATWVERTSLPTVRGAIFTRFGPHSGKYLDLMLKWWAAEEDAVAAGFLTQGILKCTRPQNALRVWQVCQQISRRPCTGMLLAKLAKIPSISADVTERIVRELKAGEVPAWELRFLIEVADARVMEQIESRAHSSDPAERVLVARLLGKRKRLPSDVFVSKVPPERASEIYSMDIDVSQLRGELTKVESEIGVAIPDHLKDGQFLQSAKVNQWVRTTLDAKPKAVDLWFRLEDFDAVEVVFARHARGR